MIAAVIRLFCGLGWYVMMINITYDQICTFRCKSLTYLLTYHHHPVRRIGRAGWMTPFNYLNLYSNHVAIIVMYIHIQM